MDIRRISTDLIRLLAAMSVEVSLADHHRNVHARAENFSIFYIMHVLQQNYFDFLSFQLISLIVEYINLLVNSSIAF